MKNLFDLKCPVCGEATNLSMEIGEDGDVVYVRLGGWSDRKADQARAELEWKLWWYTPVCCDACGYEGRCDSFDGEYAAWARKARKVMERFHHWFPRSPIR
jgi:hypothetical protein